MSQDPFSKYLKIPPGRRPPTACQILGIREGETDNREIEDAAARRLDELDQYALSGDHRVQEQVQQLMNLVAKARSKLIHKNSEAQTREYFAAADPDTDTVDNDAWPDTAPLFTPRPTRSGRRTLASKLSRLPMGVWVGLATVWIVTVFASIAVTLMLAHSPPAQDDKSRSDAFASKSREAAQWEVTEGRGQPESGDNAVSKSGTESEPDETNTPLSDPRSDDSVASESGTQSEPDNSTTPLIDPRPEENDVVKPVAQDPMPQEAEEVRVDLAWIRQIGTSAREYIAGVATDSMGNVYIAGGTRGSLASDNEGDYDAYLSRYNANGDLSWTRQIGTSSDDSVTGVAVDAAGNIYLSGYTGGSLAASNAGGVDAFLVCYTPDGALAWKRQFGTSVEDYGMAVAVTAAGEAYVTGYTSGDADSTAAYTGGIFLSRYNADGTAAWSSNTSTRSPALSYDVAVDSSGNAYITGHTEGRLGGTNAGGEDIFLARYTPEGALAWTRQFGSTGNDSGPSIAIDTADNIYISGYTNGSLGGTNAGIFDAFLARYKPDGTLVWTRQLGTSKDDRSHAVAVDAAGSIYITGNTTGDLGESNTGIYDVFLARYEASSKLIWTEQFGTSGQDYGHGVAVQADGSIYVAGQTSGSLSGTYMGGIDAFLVKYEKGKATDLDLVDVPRRDKADPILPNEDNALSVIRLDAADAERNDGISRSVDVSQSVAIIGAWIDDTHVEDSGSAYLFDTRSGKVSHKLVADDAKEKQRFGFSVGISESTAIVGAYYDDHAGDTSGAAYLFDVQTGRQTYKLTAKDTRRADHFGYSVGVGGDVAIVGAWANSGGAQQRAGAAYLFDIRTGKQIHKLTAEDAVSNDWLGMAVDTDGRTAIAGAQSDRHAGTGSGSAYLFDVESGKQTFKLTASDAVEKDWFGHAVAVQGSTAVIGAPRKDAVYLFDTQTGRQTHKLATPDDGPGRNFGESVDISGNVVIVGGQGLGVAYLYDAKTGKLLEILDKPDTENSSSFGRSVAIDANASVVGDSYSEDGFAFIFDTSKHLGVEDEEAGDKELGLPTAYKLVRMGSVGKEVGANISFNEKGVGVGFDRSSNKAYVYHPNGELQYLPIPEGYRPYAINDEGIVVGLGRSADGARFAFRWSANDGLIDLGKIEGSDSMQASGINNSGACIGLIHAKHQWDDGENRGSRSIQRAFKYTGAKGIINLGTLGGLNSWAQDINEHGTVVGFADSLDVDPDEISRAPFHMRIGMTGRRAAMWKQGKIIDMGTLGGPTSMADEINNNGYAIGRSDTDALRKYRNQEMYVEHGFIFSELTGMQSLGSFVPIDINDRNWILGGVITRDENTATSELVVRDLQGRTCSLAQVFTKNGIERPVLLRKLNNSGQIFGYTIKDDVIHFIRLDPIFDGKLPFDQNLVGVWSMPDSQGQRITGVFHPSGYFYVMNNRRQKSEDGKVYRVEVVDGWAVVHYATWDNRVDAFKIVDDHLVIRTWQTHADFLANKDPSDTFNVDIRRKRELTEGAQDGVQEKVDAWLRQREERGKDTIKRADNAEEPKDRENEDEFFGIPLE